MDGIEVVILDVGGVLLVPDPELLGGALRQHDVEHDIEALAIPTAILRRRHGRGAATPARLRAGRARRRPSRRGDHRLGGPGVSQPDPRAFAPALDALRRPAERCAYIGDTVTFDVVGARNAGLVPIHLDTFRTCVDHDHAHARSLDKAVELAVVAP